MSTQVSLNRTSSRVLILEFPLSETFAAPYVFLCKCWGRLSWKCPPPCLQYLLGLTMANYFSFSDFVNVATTHGIGVSSAVAAVAVVVVAVVVLASSVVVIAVGFSIVIICWSNVSSVSSVVDLLR